MFLEVFLAKMKKWRIYPRGAAFWITFGIIMVIILIFIAGSIIVPFSEEELILEIVLTIILYSVLIGVVAAYFLANISIDENNCLKMPFFCRNLMPAFAEKKEKIILKKDLIDVHLKFVRMYTYLGFEDKKGVLRFINVTMFSKKQQVILQHKLEEYKID